MTRREIVERPNEPGTFDVWSTDGKYKYIVDIFELNGNGVCSCRDFQVRCYHNFNENGNLIVDYGITTQPNPDRTLCKHLQKVRFHYLNSITREIYRTRRKEPDGQGANQAQA